MIKFGCPNCGKKIGVGDDAAGKKAKCPGCGRILDIPPLPRASGQEASKAVQSGSGTSVSNVQSNSQLDELAAAMSETVGSSAKDRAPSFPSATATRQPGKMANRWILWGVLLGVVGVVVIGAMQTGLLSRAGFAAGLTDIRKVTADPRSYAGQTLESRGIMIGARAFSAIGTVNAKPLQLMSSPALDSKAMKIRQSIASYQTVMIKYRIYDQATLAKIEAYENAEKLAQANEARIRQTADDAIKVNIQKEDEKEEARVAREARAVNEEEEILRNASRMRISKTYPSLSYPVSEPDTKAYAEAEKKVGEMREARKKAEELARSKRSRIMDPHGAMEDSYEKELRAGEARRKVWEKENSGIDLSCIGVLLDVWIP